MLGPAARQRYFEFGQILFSQGPSVGKATIPVSSKIRCALGWWISGGTNCGGAYSGAVVSKGATRGAPRELALTPLDQYAERGGRTTCQAV